MSAAPSSASPPSPTPAQQVISLLLVVHLFCLAVALSSYTLRSPLQFRLLGLLAPYTRTLNLAPDQAPFHLTQYDALSGRNEPDDELWLEIEIAGADGKPVRVPLDTLGVPFPDARRRYRTFAAEMSSYTDPESGSDDDAAEFAKAAGGFALRALKTDAGVIRLERHISQPRSLADIRAGYPPNPLDAAYRRTLYEADVLLDDEGGVQLIKREPKEQVAPVVSPAATGGAVDE